MVATNTDAPQALADRDCTNVKQTINQFMTGNIDANDARFKLQSESQMMLQDKAADQVGQRLAADVNLPSEFPNLSVTASGGTETVKEASSKNGNQVDFDGSAFSVKSQAEAAALDQSNTQMQTLADNVLNVSSQYLNGKMSGSEAQKELTPLVASGANVGSSSGENQLSLEGAIAQDASKFGLQYQEGSTTDYGLALAGDKNWNSIDINNGKVDTTNGTAVRLEHDAAYAGLFAASGAAFGPVGAAVGAVAGLAVGEIQHYEANRAIKMGTENVLGQTVSSQVRAVAQKLN